MNFTQDIKQNIKSHRSVQIAIVGDVHNQWEPEDELALQALGVDLVLFVGDFGNEAVEVVEAIAAVSLPKAMVFGNHDAWYSMTEWGRQKCPYDRSLENRVQKQLDLAGDAHVGYEKQDFPALGLSVVGSRPFTWGGSKWRDTGFYQEWFGVDSFTASADRIVAAAQTTAHNTLVLIGHNGPSGLGAAPEDPCGKDWKPIGGDCGDPDFAQAIARIQDLGKAIPLVAFGHMHHNLKHTRDHLRKCVSSDPIGTLYLNAARVPRIVEVDRQKRRNFSLALLEDGVVTQTSLVWIDQNFQVMSEELLYCHPKNTQESISVLHY
ncbi:MAG: TIGR04168 family protein [Oscillatoriales cyanobacterium RM2_1_1]|nr:TIGR04168 family protein [Oscillatoriales cyanobacterium SM2_3_0]NJO46555.1 TIGR04168 family protein [Oscillatoriales cyanobacterium RM2_1_1]